MERRIRTEPAAMLQQAAIRKVRAGKKTGNCVRNGLLLQKSLISVRTDQLFGKTACEEHRAAVIGGI